MYPAAGPYLRPTALRYSRSQKRCAFRQVRRPQTRAVRFLLQSSRTAPLATSGLNVLSSLPESAQVPSGENATAVTRQSALRRCGSTCRWLYPTTESGVLAADGTRFQIAGRSSRIPPAPHGPQGAHRRAGRCPFRQALSLLPDSSHLPSGRKSSPNTPGPWPANVRTKAPVAAFHKRCCHCCFLLSGEKATDHGTSVALEHAAGSVRGRIRV